MLFGKKNKEPKQLPMDEVKRMANRGMSDKEIIKELKGKGFDYKDIEKAMLQAVKEGVGEEPSTRQDNEAFSPPDIFGAPPEASYGNDLPTFEEETAQNGDQSDVIIEELIEGVVEEKWEKFEDRIVRIEESLEHLNAQLRQYDAKIGQKSQELPAAEDEARIAEVANRLEDLDARVGGLEKAFKQFLPSLTRNIESLSHMIHEMKEKSGHMEIEEETM